MLPIIQKSTYWYLFSGILIAISVVALATWGLKFGIDFTGGSLLSIGFKEDVPAASVVNETLSALDLGDLTLQPTGDKGFNIRFREVTDQKRSEILGVLHERFSGMEERSFSTVGGVIGKELRTRSVEAVFVVLAFVLLFLAWSFRKVSRPVESWKYGIGAIIALFHDVIILLGAASILGHYARGMEINAAFIAAVLTVLAYSVSDTIVVYDRTRENLVKMRGASFADVVNASVNQTMQRSIYTSFTIMLSLAAIVLFGGESIRYFALSLIIGIFFGTYSSIFIASPILVTWNSWKSKQNLR